MKTTKKISLLMLAAVAALPGCSTVEDNPRVTTAAAAMQKSADYRAQLRAEANEPGLSREARARIGAVVAQRKARDMEMLAQYEQFKMDQRLRLAEASSPKFIVVNSPGRASGDIMPAAYSHRPGRDSDTLAEWLRSAGASGSARTAPLDSKTVEFYRRQVLDASADALVKDAAEREAAGDANTSAQGLAGRMHVVNEEGD